MGFILRESMQMTASIQSHRCNARRKEKVFAKTYSRPFDSKKTFYAKDGLDFFLRPSSFITRYLFN